MSEPPPVYGRQPGSAGVWLQDPAQVPTAPSPFRRLRQRFERNLRASTGGARWIADQFHQLYYDNGAATWRDTTWRGVPIRKCALDLWVYQELILELRPDLIIETGTFNGGSAMFFADLLDLAGGGSVVSIDLDSDTPYPEHARVEYVSGSSVDTDVVEAVRRHVATSDRVMVVLDSDHRAVHVADELVAYAPFVTPGSYLVVEDTNINGHPVLPRFGPGPTEAVRDFLQRHPEFEPDLSREKFYVSFNRGGWLRRSPES